MKRRRDSHPDNSNSSTPYPGIDGYFDRELSPESIESLLASLQRSPSQRKQFDDTQSMLDDLRAPVDSPDFTGSILEEVGRRRGWLSTGGRRLVFAGRLATAACLLLVITGLLLVRRENPEAFQTVDRSGPVSEIVQAGGAEAGAGLRAISEGLATIERRCEPAVALAASSVMTCDTVCKRTERQIVASSDQDYSMPLSPGVGQWLSASSVKVTIVVSNSVRSNALAVDHDASFNRWDSAPEWTSRFPSYDASAGVGPRLMNVADWTMLTDRVR